MVVELKRKKGETFEAFYRRFVKKLQQSGRLLQARKIRFYERPKSRTKIKRDTLIRRKIQAKKEYLKKIGKLTDDNDTNIKIRVRK